MRNRKWEIHNREKVRVSRLMVNSYDERRILVRIRHRAKKKGLPFNLEISDITIPEFCPVLKIKIHRGNGRGAKNHPDSPSVDRIIPELGYTKGNIRVISQRANLLKSNASVEELELVLEDLKKLLNV